MQRSLSRAGLAAQYGYGVDRPETERYFVALSTDGSLRQAGGSPIPGCHQDAGLGTGHGYPTFSEAGASGDRCG